MKKVILGAALCGAAVGLAGASNADGYNSDFLSRSTDALVLGRTGIPTPDAAYISDAENLYLNPNGYDGTPATTVALTTPKTNDFTTSVPQGEQDLTNAVVADYDTGDMDCNTAGVCNDPLTIFTYSQSSAIASLDEPTLTDDSIPSDALRFVMLGANPTGVPDNLYPTEVYNINGGFYAQPGSDGKTLQGIEYGMLDHDAYLGLTPTEIASATPAVEGMTTVNDIPALTTAELTAALLAAAPAGAGL